MVRFEFCASVDVTEAGHAERRRITFATPINVIGRLLDDAFEKFSGEVEASSAPSNDRAANP